ncbi:MAG: DUF3048 domain-containing protein [Acutalibacteraceae bacterium]|nr:DUF3048 domain-containing protein [Acutalibacteraceae bacterium]
MFKKIIAAILCFSMLLAIIGCGAGNPSVEEVSNPEPSSSEPPQPTYYVNPLTGVKNLLEEQRELRPVAVMINNINVAQGVQTGVQKADIVYETEVEGGITRLLAVYKDISVLNALGTIRSARYPYIELALGHDAIYVHHGMDYTYAKPYLSSSGVAAINIGSPYAYREKNGLATEHTLYTDAEKLKAGIEAKKFRSTTTKNDTFANFTADDEKIVPSEGGAVTATVKFSNYATSIFTYNEQTGLYTKNTKGKTNKDVKSGETYDFKNVFVLATTVSYYPDNKHRKVALNSGSGYYVSEGGYQAITWQKGSGSASFKFFAADGSELKVNAGNSWVCLHSKEFAPKFEAPAPETSSAVQ